MKRRTFLASAMASSAAPALATASHPFTAAQLPTAVDPIIAKFKRWEMAQREWDRLSNSYPEFDTPEMVTLEQESYDLFNEIIAMKAETVDGLRCQIILMWEEHGPDIVAGDAGERADPDLRLKCQILLGIERICQAPSWQPTYPKTIHHSQF
jgi:hypothetical protein